MRTISSTGSAHAIRPAYTSVHCRYGALDWAGAHRLHPNTPSREPDPARGYAPHGRSMLRPNTPSREPDPARGYAPYGRSMLRPNTPSREPDRLARGHAPYGRSMLRPDDPARERIADPASHADARSSGGPDDP
jgi:hypothetical protein